ncbi:MAG TPA: DUF1761 domain-containing protein [Patescibacteria group bacterium]|nr:DUF1761 domain-containing protein [Patescibacteria group bacterium]
MINLNTNWVTILASAVATMVLGFLWYSPILFGKEWMELIGLNKEDMEKAKKSMPKTYLVSALTSVITAFVLKQFIDLFYIVNIYDAVQLAFWVWFGFIATTLVTGVLFEGKSWKLFIINSGYQLASVILMSVILSYWV